MIRKGTINTNNSSENNSFSIATNFTIRGYSFSLPQDKDLYPLMDLPASLRGLVFEGTAITHEPYQLFPANPKVGNVPLQKVTISLPKADELLTEYGEKYLKYRFTIEVLTFNGVKAKIPQSSSETSTSEIKYNLDIMKALNKESAGEVEGSYQAQLQKTIAYYQGHQAIIYDFNTKLNALKLEYIEKLQKVEYKYNSEDKKIPLGYVLTFMTNVNVNINRKLTEFITLLQRMSASEDSIKY